MGLDIHALKVLEVLKADVGSGKLPEIHRVLTLGRQELTRDVANRLHPRSLRAPSFSKNPYYAEPLIRSTFNCLEVESLDVSDYEGATLIHDMNSGDSTTLPQNHFNLILDFGTTEHIFNVPNALLALRAMLADGGTIVHLVPSNGHSGHGLYQFSPSLFQEVYSQKNGFTCAQYVIKTGGPGHRRFWWEVANSAARNDFSTLYPTYLLAVANRTVSTHSGLRVVQPDYEQLWSRLGTGSDGESRSFFGVLRKLAKSSTIEGRLEEIYAAWMAFARNLKWILERSLSSFTPYFNSNRSLRRVRRSTVETFCKDA
jgi:hypothetical protein